MTEHKFKEITDGDYYWDECEKCGYKLWNRKGSVSITQTTDFFQTDEYLKCKQGVMDLLDSK